MSDTHDWDQYKNTGGYVSFKEVGDTVVGTIKTIRTGNDFNFNPCPELVLIMDDGEERTLTAGQVMLKAALAEKAPQVGDKIRIVYSANGEGKPGKAPAKLFTVDVKAGDPATVYELAEAAKAATDPSEDPF